MRRRFAAVLILSGARVMLVFDWWCVRVQQLILWATTPKDTSWSLHNRRFLVASVSSWKCTWRGTICNFNLSCQTKRFHGTKRICQVAFNIYIVGVVSMHSPLSLHSRSIPTVNRLMQKQQASLRCVSTFSVRLSMEDFIKSFCKRQDVFL